MYCKVSKEASKLLSILATNFCVTEKGTEVFLVFSLNMYLTNCEEFLL